MGFTIIVLSLAALGVVTDARAACDGTCRHSSSSSLSALDTDGDQWVDLELEFEQGANFQLLQSDLQVARGPVTGTDAAWSQQFLASRVAADALESARATADGEAAAVSSSAIDAEGAVISGSQRGEEEAAKDLALPVATEVLPDGTAAPAGTDSNEKTASVHDAAHDSAPAAASAASIAESDLGSATAAETATAETKDDSKARELEVAAEVTEASAPKKSGAAPVDGAAATASKPATHQEAGEEKVETSIQVAETAANVDAGSLVQDVVAGEETAATTTIRTADVEANAEQLAETTGMALNAEGDLVAFMGALVSNIMMVIFCIIGFSWLRRKYPMIYSNNVLLGIAPKTARDGFFSWIASSLDTTTEQAAQAIGLDNAMMLEFTKVGMRITMRIGIPMLLLIGPMNCAFGGNAAGNDHLSYLSFGNVKDKSWLYWVHSIMVWYVVAVVQVSIYQAQPKFLALRFAWLRSMPAIRAQTIYVENIPPEHCSDDKLKAFFSSMFAGSGRVKSAYVVKDTTTLVSYVEEQEALEKKLKEAKFAEDSKNAKRAVSGDSTTYYKNELSRLAATIKKEKAAILTSSKQEVGGVNGSNGFVTFSSRMDAEIAVRLDYMEDADVLQVSTPPCTTDILWEGVKQPVNMQKAFEIQLFDYRFELFASASMTVAQAKGLIGLGLTAALYFGYLPIVLLVTNIAKLVNMGPLQPLWQGLAPTMGLQFMVAFLPTFLLWIFRLCYCLKASAWEQQKLQAWYFWFQLVFVVLATAVGQDLQALLDFTNMLVTDPTGIFVSLAKTMPYATHFYMNFIVLQWATHAMILTRYIPLSKFLAFRNLFEDEDARQLSEPEDQDYYGIGARSARWTILLVIAIVYGTLSPPINLLAFVNFAVCRLVYGYLLPFAETRKADLGGVFWMQMCKHVFFGNIIYCALMIGVFMVRAATWGPVVISAPTIGYVIWSMKRFDTAFSWERLPFMEISKQPEIAGYDFGHPGGDLKFVQPELE